MRTRATPRMTGGKVENETRRVPMTREFALPGHRMCRMTLTSVYALDENRKEAYRGMVAAALCWTTKPPEEREEGGVKIWSLTQDSFKADSWMHPKDREHVNGLSEIRRIANHDFRDEGVQRCVDELLGAIGAKYHFNVDPDERRRWKEIKAHMWCVWRPKKAAVIMTSLSSQTELPPVVNPPRKQVKATQPATQPAKAPATTPWKMSAALGKIENLLACVRSFLAVPMTAPKIAELCKKAGWRSTFKDPVDEIRQLFVKREKAFMKHKAAGKLIEYSMAK
jgi:hypothetical protein